MIDLLDLNSSQVIDYLVYEQVQMRGISKALAKKLVLNALLYNVVTEEVNNQISFLLEVE